MFINTFFTRLYGLFFVLLAVSGCVLDNSSQTTNYHKSQVNDEMCSFSKDSTMLISDYDYVKFSDYIGLYTDIRDQFVTNHGYSNFEIATSNDLDHSQWLLAVSGNVHESEYSMTYVGYSPSRCDVYYVFAKLGSYDELHISQSVEQLPSCKLPKYLQDPTLLLGKSTIRDGITVSHTTERFFVWGDANSLRCGRVVEYRFYADWWADLILKR
ncbi:MAG: hypothetical protein JKY46_03800 [Robiginitomaculum sp.]|nr:hypothetical protein [Robiginitomaculum sp.]